MSKPTPERIHRKKLARLRKRRTLYAYHRVGIDNPEGKLPEEPMRPWGFRKVPRK